MLALLENAMEARRKASRSEEQKDRGGGNHGTLEPVEVEPLKLWGEWQSGASSLKSGAVTGEAQSWQ